LVRSVAFDDVPIVVVVIAPPCECALQELRVRCR